MEITGKITGIRYRIFLSENLENIDIKNFNVNTAPSACVVQDGQNTFAVSFVENLMEKAVKNGFEVKIGNPQTSFLPNFSNKTTSVAMEYDINKTSLPH